MSLLRDVVTRATGGRAAGGGSPSSAAPSRKRARPWRSVLSATLLAMILGLALADGGRAPGVLAALQSLVLALVVVAIVAARTEIRVPGPLVLMVAAIAVTTIPSVRPEAGVRELLLWLTYGGIAVLAALATRRSREWFLDGLVLIAGWLCLVALFWFWGSGNLSHRWSSTFYWPNPFAAFLLLLLPLCLARCLAAVARRAAIAQGGAFVLLAVALIFTYSRGAWLAAAIALCAVPLVVRRRSWASAARRMAALVLAVGVGVLLLGRAATTGPSGVVARAASLADPEDASARGHLMFWRSALQMLRDHPVAGTGPGTFGAVHAAYQHDVRYYARDAHSLYLQTGAEMGVIGLVALLALLVWAGRAWRRALRGAADDGEHARVAGIGLGLVAFLLHNGVDMDWSFPANPALAFALAGVVGGMAMARAASGATAVPRGVWAGPRLLPILLAAVATVQCFGFGHRSFARGQAAASAGRWREAAEAYRGAQRWNPLSARYRSAEADARLRMTPPERMRAEAALREAMRLDRANAWHPLQLGMLLLYAPGGPSAHAEAERLLRAARRLDPYNRPQIYTHLAALQRRAGRDADAARTYADGLERYLGHHTGDATIPSGVAAEIADLVVAASDHRTSRGDTAGALALLEAALRKDQIAGVHPRLRAHAEALHRGDGADDS